MEASMTLPEWLDDYIFNKLGAKYCQSNTDMTVIDWDKRDVLNYLGTYFPRSYTEAYCIFNEYFKNHTSEFSSKEELSIFDFGCGTGGEIIGLLTVLNERFPNLKKVKIVALDGNRHALQQYEKVLSEFNKIPKFDIHNHIAHICIDDFYDLSILDSVIKNKFDIILSFKAICEFVTKQQFEKKNAYEHIGSFLLPKLTDNGLMLFVDITTYSDTSKEWLPIMMDKGLRAAHCTIVKKNEGYNQTYKITHSHKQNDTSKVAWRMIKRDNYEI